MGSLREMTLYAEETVMPMSQTGASCSRNRQKVSASSGNTGGGESRMVRRDHLGLRGHCRDVGLTPERQSHGRTLSIGPC